MYQCVVVVYVFEVKVIYPRYTTPHGFRDGCGPNKPLGALNVSEKSSHSNITLQVILHQQWFDASEQESVGLVKMLLRLLRCGGFQGVVQSYLEVFLESAEVISSLNLQEQKHSLYILFLSFI